MSDKEVQRIVGRLIDDGYRVPKRFRQEKYLPLLKSKRARNCLDIYAEIVDEEKEFFGKLTDLFDKDIPHSFKFKGHVDNYAFVECETIFISLGKRYSGNLFIRAAAEELEWPGSAAISYDNMFFGEISEVQKLGFDTRTWPQEIASMYLAFKASNSNMELDYPDGMDPINGNLREKAFDVPLEQMIRRIRTTNNNPSREVRTMEMAKVEKMNKKLAQEEIEKLKFKDNEVFNKFTVID